MQDIATLRHFPAIGPPTSVGIVYMGPFFYYLMAPFLLVANFNPLGLAIGTAILSILALIVVSGMVTHYTNKKTALLFMLILTLSSVLIDSAKYAWNPNLLPYFAFATFFFYYTMLTKNNGRTAE